MYKPWAQSLVIYLPTEITKPVPDKQSSKQNQTTKLIGCMYSDSILDLTAGQ